MVQVTAIGNVNIAELIPHSHKQILPREKREASSTLLGAMFQEVMLHKKMVMLHIGDCGRPDPPMASLSLYFPAVIEETGVPSTFRIRSENFPELLQVRNAMIAALRRIPLVIPRSNHDHFKVCL